MPRCPYVNLELLIEVEYLGHLVSEKGVRANPKKVASMLDWPISTNTKSFR